MFLSVVANTAKPASSAAAMSLLLLSACQPMPRACTTSWPAIKRAKRTSTQLSGSTRIKQPIEVRILGEVPFCFIWRHALTDGDVDPVVVRLAAYDQELAALYRFPVAYGLG